MRLRPVSHPRQWACARRSVIHKRYVRTDHFQALVHSRCWTDVEAAWFVSKGFRSSTDIPKLLPACLVLRPWLGSQLAVPLSQAGPVYVALRRAALLGH